jgi:hypothetical protein
MRVELNVELYAIAVGVEGEMGVGSVRHDLEIVTQTDVLFLPISANILSCYMSILTKDSSERLHFSIAAPVNLYHN